MLTKIRDCNHLESSRENEQDKNRWRTLSSLKLHKQHLEAKTHPLSFRWSSMGNLSNKNLQRRKDLDGGTAVDQIVLPQETEGCREWKKDLATFKERIPS